MRYHLSQKGLGPYIRIAKKILRENWSGAYTRPSRSLYPHQWNWDSGFIAMGTAHYDQRKARQEIQSLLNHQWPNGMVPQIIFNPEGLGHYFPEPDFWQVPGGRLTSGITMPPLAAVAVLHILQLTRNRRKTRDFARAVFPKLKAAHRYLYENRDPKKRGLVYIRHPWESGLDNSPAWDAPLKQIHVSKATLPPYERTDLQHGIPAEQWPRDEDYDRYVYLVDLFRKAQYNEKDIYQDCPFRWRVMRPMASPAGRVFEQDAVQWAIFINDKKR